MARGLSGCFFRIPIMLVGDRCKELELVTEERYGDFYYPTSRTGVTTKSGGDAFILLVGTYRIAVCRSALPPMICCKRSTLG